MPEFRSPLIDSRGTFRPMLRLAAPVLIEHLLYVLVDYTDLWLAGRFLQSASYVAAMTVVGYSLWLIFNLFSFVAVGATAMTARFVGAGDRSMANRVANQAMLIGGVWSLLLMAIGLTLAGPLVGLTQLEGETADAARRYLSTILLVLPLMMVEEIGIACLRGAGDMVTGLVVMAAVNVINVAVSSTLLLGLGPFPELGWQGLAIGTATAHTFGGLTILYLLCRGRAGYRLHRTLMRPEGDFIRRILRIGLPGGTDMVSIALLHMWFVSVINQLGSLSTAAHGVAVRIEALAYMPGGAFQVAAATMVGQFLGARDFRRATRSVGMACLVGGGLMTAVGLLFFFHSQALAGFFLSGDARSALPIAAQLLQIVAISMPALALGMILGGALRGAGDTHWPLVFTLVGFLAVRIPLAYLLAYPAFVVPGLNWHIAGWGLGVVGAWYAMVSDIFVRCALVVARFLHGGWQSIRV